MYNVWVENRGTEARERNEKYNREKRKCILECSLTLRNNNEPMLQDVEIINELLSKID